MPTPAIHRHHKPQSSLLPLLSAHLPYSGPLFRRIQHSLTYPSETAHILATFPQAPTATSVNPHSPWLAAYVDVYAGRETQIWLYSSVEAGASVPSIHEWAAIEGLLSATDQWSKLVLEPEIASEIQAQLLCLCLYIQTHLIPPYISYLESQGNGRNHPPDSSPQTPFHGKSVKKIPSHPPTSFMFGSLHTGIYDLLQATKTTPENIPPHLPRIRIPPRDSGVYLKYIFHRSTYDPLSKKHEGTSEISDNDSGLPQGYRFHDLKRRSGVQAQQLDLVLSRTDIPRSKKILQQNPSVAVYYDGGADDTCSSCPGVTANRDPGCALGEMPVAWAFLGLDGSLCTLHVEEGHRRHGLARVIGREVMKLAMGEKGGVFTAGFGSRSGFDRGEIGEIGKGEDDNDQGWIFADVSLQNKVSRKVMGKLGGEPAWTVKWVVVEVVED
ncbi:hypothetical protein ACJ73_00513 [Blastomyces percursus]|uniref:FR47-like domain-containing protein n=1 Tax=Blastomyces percursus TaxID=1658174 RepID=A0A1J9QGW9_9EURO|nr:hypothetical protein ACJ73_00513 [Blastomyces percursus]